MTLVTILGFIAAVFTTSAVIPQAIKIFKTKKTKDISLFMYLIMCTGVFLWMIYGIFRKDYPVIIANATTLIFTSIVLGLKIKYG